MTRIISGLARSLRLDVPKSGTRPTSDRVREAIFSALNSWNMLEGVHVLDLFAGSGALGLEAISRGAQAAVFVEKQPPAAQIIQRNIDRVRTTFASSDVPDMRVHRQSAQSFLDELESDAVWHVVFVDPPYEFPGSQLTMLLEALSEHLSPEGLIMVERSTRDGEPQLPDALSLYKTKKYGETTLWWIEHTPKI